MSMVTAFPGRKPGDANGKTKAAAVAPQEATGDGAPLDDIGVSLGKEHEALRTMLNDAALRIGSLDLVKEAYTKISEPIAKTMQALEQEKLQNATLQSLLSGLSATHQKQRSELTTSKQRGAVLESENAKLRQDLQKAQEEFRSSEAARGKLASQLTSKGDAIASLEHQLAHERAQCQRFSSERDTLAQQLSAAEKRIAQFEADAAKGHEKSVLTEAELRSLHGSLDDAVAESSRLSRRLTEAESNLAASNAKAARLGTEVTAAIAERDRAVNALHDTNGRHQAEAHALSVRLDALQARAQSAENLLAETRQALALRTEEARKSERNSAEVAITLNAANKKIKEFEAQAAEFMSLLTDAEASHKAMTARAATLERNLRDREAALVRFKEHTDALTDRIAKLESDLEGCQTDCETRVEEVNVALQRERMERSMVEGSLEAMRRDYVILHKEYTKLHENLESGGIIAV